MFLLKYIHRHNIIDMNESRFVNFLQICLPPNNGQTYAGKNAVLTGWGRRGYNDWGGSDVLQEVTLKVTKNIRLKMGLH